MEELVLLGALAGALLAAPGETDFAASPHANLKSIGLRHARWTVPRNHCGLSHMSVWLPLGD